MDTNETKNKIIALVSALFPEAKIYLYGSRARGNHSERSDFDIAIDAGAKVHRRRISEAKDVLAAANIWYSVDVVDFHNIPEEMKANIERERVIWKD